jgi:hypothetical protein
MVDRRRTADCGRRTVDCGRWNGQRSADRGRQDGRKTAAGQAFEVGGGVTVNE